MITIACGFSEDYPEFDWLKYSFHKEERTEAFVDLLGIMDAYNATIRIRRGSREAEANSLFIKKFILPHISEQGLVKETKPDIAYWPSHYRSGGHAPISYKLVFYAEPECTNPTKDIPVGDEFIVDNMEGVRCSILLRNGVYCELKKGDTLGDCWVTDDDRKFEFKSVNGEMNDSPVSWNIEVVNTNPTKLRTLREGIILKQK